jgi:hypothetical protein
MLRAARSALLFLIVLFTVIAASSELATVKALLLGAALGLLAIGCGLLCGAWRRSAHEFTKLKEMLASVESARVELLAANIELREDNVALRSMDVAFREILNLADERSRGQLRDLVGQVGDALAEWLEEQMNDGREEI